ncbi:MAG: primosomal replication protein N [Acidovorax sp.]|nr:primosomal replication protein N [Acidovorax sp.]MDR3003109.1 primosomal replication protein N [Acidovorax sp.]
MENHVVLTACIAEVQTMRYTPAGLPALDLRLDHESQQQEAGSARKVVATVKAVAFGALAERIARQALGSSWTFQGFLATPRNSKSVVFHIQDIQQN